MKFLRNRFDGDGVYRAGKCDHKSWNCQYSRRAPKAQLGQWGLGGTHVIIPIDSVIPQRFAFDQF